jgi:serine/threonine protein kinase
LDKLLYCTNEGLTKENKMRIIRGIAARMCHLHNHHIIHRDLAARNILLTQRNPNSADPKISDFGMSRLLKRADTGKVQQRELRSEWQRLLKRWEVTYVRMLYRPKVP